MAENPQQSGSWCDMLCGLCFGAAIGVALGLLYAPKSGKETRDELLDRFEKLRERADQTAHDIAEMARARFEETRDDLAQAVEVGRTAAAERAAELRRQTGLT